MSSARTELIAFDHVSFAYGAVKAVRNFCLSVREGEIFGLLGPNGSGKSTLVRLLSGVLAPDQGHIRFAGKELTSYSREALARRIAVVPQETQVASPFSVLEVVLMGRFPHHNRFGFESKTDIALARHVMKLTRIEELERRATHELSGGERQRVMLARALAQTPQVLLLDEPTAFLDIKHQVETYDLIKNLSRQEGLTIVSILHDLNLAALYCDRLALLKSGEMFRAGAPEEVLTYANVKAVYETEVYISLNDLTRKIHVLPLDADSRARLAETKKPGVDEWGRENLCLRK